MKDKRDIFSRLRNFLGHKDGFGGCLRCGDTWNWKKHHNISYAQGRGMFPLCEECYRSASVLVRKLYVDKLIGIWIANGLNCDEAEKSRRGAYIAVHES